MLITRECTGREYAELINSICPYSTLINIGTPKRPDVDHQGVYWEGICGTLNKKGRDEK